MTDHAPDQPTNQPADNTPPATPIARIKHAPKNKRELTARAKSIISDIVRGATERQALKNAGYSDSYIKTKALQILEHPQMQRTFAQVLDDAGVTDDSLAKDIDRLRRFSKAHIIKGLDGDKVVQVEDGNVQLGAVKLATQLKGHLVERREDTSTTNVNVLSISTEELLEIAARGRQAIDVTPSESGKGAVKEVVSQEWNNVSIGNNKTT